MIITGGEGGFSATVAAYDDNGFLKLLPSLVEGRGFHGCGHYIDGSGDMVKYILTSLNFNYVKPCLDLLQLKFQQLTL